MRLALPVSNQISPLYIESMGGNFQIVYDRMSFCCCPNMKWTALFVYKEYVKKTLLCGLGNSEGLLLSHHFCYFIYLFSSWDTFSPTSGSQELLFSLPRKSFTLALFMTGFSLDVKAFLKCCLFLEAFADFSHEENSQFPAQSLSQMKKWRLYNPCTASLYRVLWLSQTLSVLFTGIFLEPTPTQYSE